MNPRPPAREIPDGGSICTPCADGLGGRWPEGHLATWSLGRCSVCGKTKSVCDVGDWDWPDGKARGMRD